MLNIGPPELLLIIVIALVVVGPQRLPDLGRTIGRGLREFRKVQDEVRDMVDTGMGEDFKQTTAELRKTAADLRGATDVTSAFRNTPHKARQRAAEAVRAATTPDDDPTPALEANTASSAGPTSAEPTTGPTSEPTPAPEPAPSPNGSDPAAEPPTEPSA
jgi:sec-independent protein translocase protein TatB